MHPHPWKLGFILTLGMLSISSAAILVRLCDDAPPVVIAAARMGLSTILLFVGLTATRGARVLRIPRHLAPLVLLGGLLLGAHFYFWISSLRYTSVLSSVVIVTTNPIFVGLGSLLFFRERITRHLVFGILLAAAGGALISLSGSGSDGAAASTSTDAVASTPYGNALALLGAVMASGYLLIGRKVRAEVDVFSYMLGVYGVAAILLCATAAAGGHSFGGYRGTTYLYFVALAVFPQLIGHGSLNYALKHLSATVVAVCILAEPVGAGILAYLLLGEGADGRQIVGAALILAGIFTATRRQPGGEQKIRYEETADRV